jgi:hypothetical protein
MKYAAEMGSGATTYVPSFIKLVQALESLSGEGGQTHRQDGNRISLLLFLQNKDSGQKKKKGLILPKTHYEKFLVNIPRNFRLIPHDVEEINWYG